MGQQASAVRSAGGVEPFKTSGNPPIVQPVLPKVPVSVYRRVLPGNAISFSSDDGRAIFREALADGTMETFFPLMEQFHTQEEPSFCGLATLVIVLNAFNVDPGKNWKGPWRFYHERALDCCKSPERIEEEGIDFDEWVCLARCQGLRVDATRTGDDAVSVERFRQVVQAACSNKSASALVVSYDRGVVGQTGTGHFSPVGGYHRGLDLMLILDTARFKYPPHWLPVADVLEATRAVDPSTGMSRGYALLSLSDMYHSLQEDTCFSLGVTNRQWVSLHDHLAGPVVDAVLYTRSDDEAVRAIAGTVPAEYHCIIATSATERGGRGQRNGDASEETSSKLLAAFARTRLYELTVEAYDRQKTPFGFLKRMAILIAVIGRAGLLESEAGPRTSAGASIWQRPMPTAVHCGPPADEGGAEEEVWQRLENEIDKLAFQLKQISESLSAHTCNTCCGGHEA